MGDEALPPFATSKEPSPSLIRYELLRMPVLFVTRPAAMADTASRRIGRSCSPGASSTRAPSSKPIITSWLLHATLNGHARSAYGRIWTLEMPSWLMFQSTDALPATSAMRPRSASSTGSTTLLCHRPTEDIPFSTAAGSDAECPAKCTITSRFGTPSNSPAGLPGTVHNTRSYTSTCPLVSEPSTPYAKPGTAP